MGIALMSYVPHQLVVGSVVNIVDGYGQLYSPEARPEMSRVGCQLAYDETAKLLAQLRQTLHRQLLKVGG